MTAYFDGTIRDYIDDLGGRKIVPGGGSAAALTAATGAGLNMMVINFSINPEKGICSEEWKDIKVKQEKSINLLKQLIDEDCEAFTSLMEELKKGNASDSAYVRAADVPLRISRECAESMQILLFLSEEGNKNLMTDVACSAHILKAAHQAAKVNVYINLKNIKDADYVGKVTDEMESIEKSIEEVFNSLKLTAKWKS